MRIGIKTAQFFEADPPIAAFYKCGQAREKMARLHQY
jgi:hypothetical protein